MRHFKLHPLAVLPLLALLTVAPSELPFDSAGRSIASVITEEKADTGTPLYDAMVSKLDRSALMKKDNVEIEQFITDLKDLDNKLELKLKESAPQRQEVESLAIKLVLSEDDLSVLQDKKLLTPEVEAEALEQMASNKTKLEKLLAQTEEKEEIVQTEPEVEECTDDKHAVLTTQVEQLMTQQTQIMESIMSMLGLMQQQQMNQWNPYMHGPLVPYAHMYQYASSTSNGAWVYMPNGFNPTQFGAGFYPDQLQQPQPQPQLQQQQWNGWGLANQYDLQLDPYYQVPGQNLSANFGFKTQDFGFKF